MKTLYIDINNEHIQSNSKLEVLHYDLDSDFFFYLGEKISKGCCIENENAIITDFNTAENKEDFKQIISQWKKLKDILFSEKHGETFEFSLPKGYIHWLKFHPQYVDIYDRNFYISESRIIAIDIEKLYEESIEELQRKVLRYLDKNDLYQRIDEIVFGDDAVTHKSPIVCAIQNKYKTISIITLKERIERERQKQLEQERIKREEEEKEQREKLEQERLEREKEEKEHLAQLEREKFEKERQEQLEQEKKQSGQFLSYDEYYIFRVIYHKIFCKSFNGSNDAEKRYLLVKLQDNMQDILSGKCICINRFHAEAYTNPQSPFYNPKEPEISFTPRDLSIMQFFSRICRESKFYGADWLFDETMLDEIFRISQCGSGVYDFKEEIEIPFVKSYKQNSISKVMYRSTVWHFQSSEDSFEAKFVRSY